jgi:hypothetical protein
MATKPKAPQAARARVLSDLSHFGAVNGDIVSGDSAQISALEAVGKVDSSPDAVAYAESVGAKLIELAPE